MSYSKVKQIGFPNCGDYQMAYHHVVHEACLLATNSAASFALAALRVASFRAMRRVRCRFHLNFAKSVGNRRVAALAHEFLD